LPYTPQFNIRQLTDVLRCNLQQHFRRKGSQLRNRIAMMTTTRTTELHHRRVRLTREPAAAAEARSHVRAVIRAWQVPVDLETAVLLASDLVTNAIRHQADGTITLVIASSPGQLRIDVYGTARHLPPRGPLPAAVETGAGLALVVTLADQWGWYPTPVGRAVYFTLAFAPAP
jgi:anti-sigma regulatory factor (Ser/Thr protein kinase)